jgi:hypothetical protein
MPTELTIDHVTVAGSDLKSMEARLASIGLRSEYGGPHSNHATEMALTSFPDGSYLELIAIPNGADEKAVESHYWSKELRGNAGPTAWAIRTKDIAGEIVRLEQAGAIVSDPVRAGRERPDGVRLDWETANIGSEPNGTFFPFMIQDFSKREQRAFPSGKPTTQDYSGVSRVVIAVRDVAESSARYRKVFALPVPLQQADEALGARLAFYKNTPVALAAPLDDRSFIAARLRDFGEGPCAFVLRSRHSKSDAATWKVSWFDSGKLGWHLGSE